MEEYVMVVYKRDREGKIINPVEFGSFSTEDDAIAEVWSFKTHGPSGYHFQILKRVNGVCDSRYVNEFILYNELY